MRIRFNSDKDILTVFKQFDCLHRQYSELVTGTVLCTTIFQGVSCPTTPIGGVNKLKMSC